MPEKPLHTLDLDELMVPADVTKLVEEWRVSQAEEQYVLPFNAATPEPHQARAVAEAAARVSPRLALMQ